MIRIRDHILRKVKKNKSEDNLELYIKVRNRVSIELKSSKIYYFRIYLSVKSQNFESNGKTQSIT